MDNENQIIIFLIFIVCVIIALKITVLKKQKKVKKNDVGLNIGDQFPEVIYKDIKGDIGIIKNEFFNDSRVFIIMDSNCQECSKVMSALSLFDAAYLKNLKFMFIEEEDNRRKVNNFVLNKNAKFLNADVMFNEIKVKTFPFYYIVNNEGKIIKKGFLSIYSLVEFIEENNQLKNQMLA